MKECMYTFKIKGLCRVTFKTSIAVFSNLRPLGSLLSFSNDETSLPSILNQKYLLITFSSNTHVNHKPN